MRLLKKGKIYHAEIKTATGKRTTITTRQTNEADARRAIKESGIDKVEAAAKTHRLTNDGVTRILAGKKVTIKKALVEWEAWQRTISRSPHSIEFAVRTVERWATDMDLLNAPPTSIDETHINPWINNPKADSGASSRRILLSSIRSFFEYCSIKGWSVGNPGKLITINMDILTHEQKEPTERKPFTKAELEKLVNNTEGFWKFAILIGRETGLRLGDIASLEWASFENDGEVVVWTDKRNKRVALPISDRLSNMLSEVPISDERFLYPDERAIVRDIKRRSMLSTYFGRICQRNGIEGKSFHSIRHTRISEWRRELQDAGMTYDEALLAIGKLVAHSDIKTTAGYVHD